MTPFKGGSAFFYLKIAVFYAKATFANIPPQMYLLYESKTGA